MAVGNEAVKWSKVEFRKKGKRHSKSTKKTIKYTKKKKIAGGKG